MMNSRNGFLALVLTLVSLNFAHATDLGQIPSGADVEDSLEKVKPVKETDPYIVESAKGDEVDNKPISKSSGPDYLFQTQQGEMQINHDAKKSLEDIGYTTPGTYENSDNFLTFDKKDMAKNFRKHSSGALNITYIKNDYSYESQNDIINRTIGEGYKHVKGGALYVRSDQYFFRRDYVNTYWSLGGGIGYNSGRGIFITGERSDTTFRLWEIPIDLGLGIEIPIYHWFKISGTAGPSATVLYQSRDDISAGEKGKNKMQWSYGQFANAQFKFNLTGMSDRLANQLFNESKLTNLCMNLEVRYENYSHFQDPIKVSGTSFGIGFTFEYL